MNNKGFAASVIVYSVFIFLVTLIVFFLNVHTKDVSSSIYGDESLKGYVNRIVPYDICLNNSCTNIACIGTECLTGNVGTIEKPMNTKGTLAYAIVGGKTLKNVLGKLEESNCWYTSDTPKEFKCSNVGPTNEVGLYKEVNNGGIEYYYTGNVGNNYIRFGSASGSNDKYLWRIVRINSDGTIKLTLATLIDNFFNKNLIKSWGVAVKENQDADELLTWHDLQMAGVGTLKKETTNYEDTGVVPYGSRVSNPTYFNKTLEYYPKTTDSYLNFNIQFPFPSWYSNGIGISYEIDKGYHSTFEYCYDIEYWGDYDSDKPTLKHNGGFCKWFYDCWSHRSNWGEDECDDFEGKYVDDFKNYIGDVYVSAVHSGSTLDTIGDEDVNIVGRLFKRPVINLKADVIITKGNGTYAAPYEIVESKED